MPTSWHDAAQTFFERRFIDELQTIGSGQITAPAHTLTLTIIAQGDKVLDGREMAAFCTGARVRLLQGSNHALSDFDAHLPAILDFLRLA